MRDIKKVSVHFSVDTFSFIILGFFLRLVFLIFKESNSKGSIKNTCETAS